MWTEDDRKWLYEQMQSNGIDTGDYNEFKNSLNDKTDRDWYYQKSLDLGLDVGSAEEFKSMMADPDDGGGNGTGDRESIQQQADTTSAKAQQPAQRPAMTGKQVANAGTKMAGGSVGATSGAVAGGVMGLMPEKERKAVQAQNAKRDADRRRGAAEAERIMVEGQKATAKAERIMVEGQKATAKAQRARTGEDSILRKPEEDRSWESPWESPAVDARTLTAVTNAAQQRLDERVASSRPYDPKDTSMWEASADMEAVDAIRRRNRNEYDQEHFGELWDSAVAPVFAEERKKGNEEAESNMPNSPLMVPGMTDFGHTGMNERAIIAEKYTDPERIANKTVEIVNNDPRFTDYVLDRMGIKGDDAEDENGETQKDVPQLTDWEQRYIRRLMSRESGEVANKIIQRIYDEYKKANVPESALEWILGKALYDNTWNTLNEAIIRRAAKSSGLRSQLRQMAYEEFGKTRNWVERMAAGAAPLAVDMASDVFLLPEAVGSLAAKGTLSLIERAAVNQATKRAVASGVSKTVAKNVAKETAGRYLATKAPIVNLFARSMAGAGNFATYEAQMEAVRQFGEDIFDPVAILKRAGHGALLGGGTSFMSGTLGHATAKSSRGVKFATDVAGIGLETGAFALSSGLERAAAEHVDLVDLDWADLAGENLSMVVGMKITGGVIHGGNTVQRIKERYRKSPDYDMKLNAQNIRELKAAGYDLSNIFTGMGAIGELTPLSDGSMRLTRDRELVPVRRKGKDGKLETPAIDANALNAVMRMPSRTVSSDTKRKLVWLATGKILLPEAVFGANKFMDDGKLYIETLNVEGNRIELREYTNRQKWMNDWREIDSTAKRNAVRGLESSSIDLDQKRKVLAEKTNRPTDGTSVANEALRRHTAKGGRSVTDVLDKEDKALSVEDRETLQQYIDEMEAVYEERNGELVEMLSEGGAYTRGVYAERPGDIWTELELAQSSPEGAEMYPHAELAWAGAQEGIRRRAAVEVARHKAQTRHEDGRELVVTMKDKDGNTITGEDGQPVEYYVKSGTVAFADDGSVDKSKTEGLILVVGPDGKTQKVAEDFSIDKLVRSMSNEDANDRDYRWQNRLVETMTDLAKGKVVLDVGDVATIDGKEAEVMNAEDVKTEDGTDTLFTFLLEDGTEVRKMRSELQSEADAQRMEDYARRRETIDNEPLTIDHEGESHPISAGSEETGAIGTDGNEEESHPISAVSEGYVEGAPEEYENYMRFTFVDEDGKEEHATFMGRGRVDLSKKGDDRFIEDPEGKVGFYQVDGEDEIRHENLDRLREKTTSHRPLNFDQENIEHEPLTIDDEKESHPISAGSEEATQAVEKPGTRPQQETQPKAEEKPAETFTAEGDDFAKPMPEKDGDIDFEAVVPERTTDFLYKESGIGADKADAFVDARVKAAEKALKKAEGDEPEVGTNFRAMEQKQREWRAKVDAARKSLEYWKAVKARADKLKMEEAARVLAEQKAADDERTRRAAKQEAERRAEIERRRKELEAQGLNSPGQRLVDRWDKAEKTEGHEYEITLANGEKVRGRYVLVESGAATASHDGLNGFAMSDGFPIDQNGNTVNDRNYERDKAAQDLTRNIAANYDSRALDDVPVVTPDGVVLSGNGRTIAGDIAAQQNTDGAYIEHLKRFGARFGFSAEQVEKMKHPRVVFVIDSEEAARFPYTTETFAKFNAQVMKGQSNVELAEKMGKVIDDNLFGRTMRVINRYDTLDAFYADDAALKSVIDDMRRSGVINDMQYAEMFDGESVSERGKTMIENAFIGKAFGNHPETVRKLADSPSIRRSVMSALSEVANNRSLKGGYDLEDELAQAIDLVYAARKSGFKVGASMQAFARQGELFDFDVERGTVADYNNLCVMMLADTINSKGYGELKRVLTLYNNRAKGPSSGEIDMFEGRRLTREEIIKEVKDFLKYGDKRDIKEALDGAIAERKSEAGQEPDEGLDADAGGSGIEGEDAEGEVGGERKQSLGKGGAGIGLPDAGDNAPGLVENSESHLIEREQRKLLDTIGKAIGYRVVVSDQLSIGGNGLWDKDSKTVYVAMDSERRLRMEGAFGHEVMHDIYEVDKEAAKVIEGVVEKYMGKKEFARLAKGKFGFYRDSFLNMAREAKTEARRQEWRSRADKFTDDDARQELVCDEMGKLLNDERFAERLVNSLTGVERDGFVRRVLDGIREFMGRFSGEEKKTLREMENLWVSALKKAKETPVEAKDLTKSETSITSMTDIAAQDEPHQVEFSFGTEKENQDKLREFVNSKEGRKAGWTEEKMEEVIRETSDLIETIDMALRGDHNYEDWRLREPTVRLDWRDGKMKPIVTWSRNNVEYKYDISSDLLCINNEAIEDVLHNPVMIEIMEHINEKAISEHLAKGGVINKQNYSSIGYNTNDYSMLYQVMRDKSFVVPCKGCYDFAARLKMLAGVSRKFAELTNQYIDERNKDPEAYDRKLREYARRKQERKNAKAAEKGVKPDNVIAEIGGYPLTAGTKAMAVRIAVAGDRITEHVRWQDFVSADGQTGMLSKYGGLFRAWQRTGAGRPKDKLLPEPYIGEIAKPGVYTIIAPYGSKTPSFRAEEVNRGTSLRGNSHTEFRPVNVIDEFQMIRDCFAKGLMYFKYSKELDDPRLFGHLGIKFNMSHFPEFEKDCVAAGLDANGDYTASEESVGAREFTYTGDDGKQHYNGLKGLEAAIGQTNKDVSVSSVAFSVPHLIKLMTDVPTPTDKRGWCGSIIPFHASGAGKGQLAAQGLGLARCVEAEAALGSFVEEAMKDYHKGVTNFEQVQNDRFGEGWVVVEGKKKGTKVKSGHKLEFKDGTHYYNKELGIHLFANGYVYDHELPKGKLTPKIKANLPHEFSVDYNDKVRELHSDYGYKEAADYYIEKLQEIGLVPRFSFDVPEADFLRACRDAKVDPNHPKLGWKGKGHSWNPMDAESYYSLWCDYGMTDPETGKWSEQQAVGMTDENGNRVLRLKKDAVDVAKAGLERYTTRRDDETSRVSDAILEYTRKAVEAGRMDADVARDILERNGMDVGGKFSLREGEDVADRNRSAREDRDYLDAVEKGDEDKAREMVREAAKRAGYTEVVYHQTGEDFTEFDQRHKGAGTNDYMMPFGIFLKPTDRNIGIRGDKQMPLYAKITNPLKFADRLELQLWLDDNIDGYREAKEQYDRIDTEYRSRYDEMDAEDNERYQELWNRWHAGEISEEEYKDAINRDNTKELLKEWREESNKQAAVLKELVDGYMRGSGYDGMVVEKDAGSYGRSTKTILVFDPEQVKSADTVTRDDAGEVIPLSERFDEGKKDIRWSLKEDDGRLGLGAPYQGSKGRIARRIVEGLPEGKRFVDLFSGGGAVTHAAMLSGKYGSYRMNDINPVGQQLFLDGINGKWKDYSRESMTPEEFEQVKGTPEGLVWSHNNLGRNVAHGEEGLRHSKGNISRVQRLEELNGYADKVDATAFDYRDVKLEPGDVVYADIPYEGTDQAGYGKGKFDKAAFVDWAQKQDVPIYVSESTMPDGWTEVNAFDVKAIRGKRTEKVWVQDKFAESMVREDATDEELEASRTRFSLVEDPKEVERLEKGEKVTRYRAMVKIDGKLYPPMSVYVDGKLRNPTEEGVWERSDETQFDFTQEQLDAMAALDAKEGKGTVTIIPGKLRYQKDSKNGKGMLQFRLKKDNGSDVWAAYNPYFHTSTSGMNDQFASAWNRPNLLVVEVQIPAEETKPVYTAQYAKNSTGNTPWKSGVVNGQLPASRRRTVTLAQHVKVVGEVKDAEVAKMIAEQLDGLGIEVPFNVVTPSLREELVKVGVKIGAPENNNAGKASLEAYREWKGGETTTPAVEKPGTRPDLTDVLGHAEKVAKARKRRLSLKEEDRFYSPALRAVEGVKQEKAKAEQWLSMIQKGGGLKSAEDKWIGLSEWLGQHRGETLTKAQVMQFVRDNQVRVEEVEYGEGYSNDNLDADMFYDHMNNIDLSIELDAETREKFGVGDLPLDMWDRYELGDADERELAEIAIRYYGRNRKEYFSGDKYEEENIRDICDEFLTDMSEDYSRRMREEEERYIAYYSAENPINDMRLTFTTRGLDNNREIAFTVPGIEPYHGDLPEIHFDDGHTQGRTVAWARFGETTDAEGNRVLVLDEVQSQRHQDARKKDEEGNVRGYKKDIPNDAPEVKRYNDSVTAHRGYLAELRKKYQRNDVSYGITDEERVKLDELSKAREEARLDYNIYLRKNGLGEFDNGVPEAPFEKNWHELVMKRMLRYAAENGYDKVAWTKGAQQAKRYGLSGVVDHISYVELPNGELDARAYLKNGNYESIGKTWKEVSQSVGDDIAKRMQSGESNSTESINWGYDRNGDPIRYDYKVINGEGLEVGGKGMEGFYDKMLVDFMNKYGKKWGAKVGEVELPRVEEAGRKMWSVDVTPEMKESVMKGQPMFSLVEDGLSERDYRDVLDDVYSNMVGERKRETDREAGRGFLASVMPSDIGRHGETGTPDYDESRRKAVGDAVARLASKPFEEFTDADASLWESVKRSVARVMRRETGADVSINDNELKYALGGVADRNRSASRLGPDPIEVAADVARRDELGLTPRFSLNESEKMTEDVMSDPTVGMAEKRVIRAMLDADAHKEDVKARNVAMKAIGGNLTKLRRAMSLQRKLDITTARRIADMARSLIRFGYMQNLTGGEVKRLLSATKNAVGREDIEQEAKTVMAVMTQNMLRRFEDLFYKQLSTRGQKTDANGVVVQGTLDKRGQRTQQVLRRALGMVSGVPAYGEEELNRRIADAMDKMGSESQVERGNAEDEYAGLMLAKQYMDTIGKSLSEEAELRKELKEEEEKYKNGEGELAGRSDAWNAYRRAMENAIDDNLSKRVEQYGDMVKSVGGVFGESAGRAAEWTKAQQEHMNEIYHNANSDLEGVPIRTQKKDKDLSIISWDKNNPVLRGLLSPAATFSKLMRFFGRKAVHGMGYLFDRFVRGAVDCSSNYWDGVKSAHDELDAKASQVFGKKMKWSDIFDKLRDKDEYPGIKISYWDNGEMVDDELTQGEAVYIYMTHKMQDARAAHAKMGITEDTVEHIRQMLDPKVLDLADWLQEEFLPRRREKYNAVHQRMFGADMDAIDDYFPIVRNKADVKQEKDLGDFSGDNVASTIAKNIIKRTKNSVPIKLHVDAFDQVLKHIDDMEHWAAYAEFTRDLKTLVNYSRFRNRVHNLESVEFGKGDFIWDTFLKTCAIVTDNYRAPGGESITDKVATNVAKGVTQAAIAFRYHTALKQLLSSPAFASQASFKDLLESSYNMKGSWEWAMENLPGFRKRWESRQVGDTRLMNTDSDLAFWHNKNVQRLSSAGMSANAFIDAMTVAMGSRAVFNTSYRRYKKGGYSEENARKRALQDAAIVYNESQQSSEGAFTSAVQVDRTWRSVLVSMFRNASMGYQRKLLTGMRDLKYRLKPGYKAESVEYMTKKLMREGAFESEMDEGKREALCRKLAEKVYKRAGWEALADVALYGWVLPFFWNLGPNAMYMLFGYDDDEAKKGGWVSGYFNKKKLEMLKDASAHAVAGFYEGLYGGQLMSDFTHYLIQKSMGKKLQGDLEDTLEFQSPFGSTFQQVFKDFRSDTWAGVNDMINLGVQVVAGVNPKTFTDPAVALSDLITVLMDETDGNVNEAKEAMMFALRAISTPSSELDQMLLDDIGLTSDEIEGMSAEEIAARYARYKRWGKTPFVNWARSDENAAEVDEKRMKTFTAMLRERIEALSDEDLGKAVDSSDAMVSDEATKVYTKRAKENYNEAHPDRPQKAKKASDDEDTAAKAYERARNHVDIAEDILLGEMLKDAESSGDERRAKAIRSVRNKVSQMKKGLVSGHGRSYEEVMESIREVRRQALDELERTE